MIIDKKLKMRIMMMMMMMIMAMWVFISQHCHHWYLSKKNHRWKVSTLPIFFLAKVILFLFISIFLYHHYCYHKQNYQSWKKYPTLLFFQILTWAYSSPYSYIIIIVIINKIIRVEKSIQPSCSFIYLYELIHLHMPLSSL